MTALDNRTAYIVVALLYGVLPIFTWVTLMAQRQRAVGLWCGGGLLTGIGFLLVALRGSVADVYSFDVANLLLYVGTVMRVQSLRMELGVAWRMRWLVLAVFAYAVAYKAIQSGVEDATLRLRMIYLLYLAITGLLYHLAQLARKIARVENSPSANWIFRGYILVVAILVLRQLFVISGNGEHAFVPALVTQLLTFSMILSAVVGHVGYIGLALDRSLAHEIEAATALARGEVSRRLGGKIAHLDRQRLLGTMSASLGHELTQPLSAILLNAQVARRGLQAGNFDVKQAAEFLGMIISSVHRASEIIERIRGFIVPSVRQAEVVDLQLAVREVVALVAEDARSRHVSFFLFLGSQPTRVMGDAVQFSQVILNVVRNAMEALAEVTQREIHVSLVCQEGRAMLRIRDTGPGLAQQVLSQVGQPFFTTKAAGLGMGLSISCSILEQFSGTLALKNAPGGGTLVEIQWPALNEHADRSPA
jgi:signal transduction histidine kinase